MINRRIRFKAELLQEFKERILPCKDYALLKDHMLRGLGVVIVGYRESENKDLANYYMNCCERNIYEMFEVSLSSFLFFLQL